MIRGYICYNNALLLELAEHLKVLVDGVGRGKGDQLRGRLPAAVLCAPIGARVKQKSRRVGPAVPGSIVLREVFSVGKRFS